MVYIVARLYQVKNTSSNTIELMSIIISFIVEQRCYIVIAEVVYYMVLQQLYRINREKRNIINFVQDY